MIPQKSERKQQASSDLTCNTDKASRIRYQKAISSLTSNSILGHKAINVTSGLCWGTRGSSQMSGNQATWAVQLVCYLRRAYIPRLAYSFIYLLFLKYIESKRKFKNGTKNNQKIVSENEYFKTYLTNSKCIIKKIIFILLIDK